jgi:hypothetical protein
LTTFCQCLEFALHCYIRRARPAADDWRTAGGNWLSIHARPDLGGETNGVLDVDLLFWFRRRELAVGTAIGGIVSPWLFGAAASSAAISWGRADDRWWACGVALVAAEQKPLELVARPLKRFLANSLQSAAVSW